MQDNHLIASMKAYEAELLAIRHDIHRHPETGYTELLTARLVASRLREWGLEVAEGIAGTGVVATLKGRRDGRRAIGLRADLDALFLQETPGRAYISETPGKMHACGHDGHIAMLLGAARHLAEHPDFGGTARFIFQPAEEGLGGAPKMISEGLFERFPVDAVYGMHNWPGIPAGEFHTRTGPFMAACQLWTVTFRGAGGHGGAGSTVATDLSIPLAHFVLALQTIISRNVAADQAAVVSIGPIAAGEIESANVVPSEIVIRGTTRSYDDKVHDLLTQRITEVAQAQAQAFHCTAEIVHHPRTPVLATHAEQTAISVAAATALVGAGRVNANAAPSMAGEDFADMLASRPGGFMFIGAGVADDGSFAALHTPGYDFNDEILSLGAAYWVKLV